MSEQIIAILCPTRDRPDRALTLYQSLKQTSSRAKLFFYVDDDQREIYAKVAAAAPDAVFHYGPRIGPCASVNLLVDQHRGQFSIYGMAPDHSRFATPGWDEWVIETVVQMPGRIGVISPAHKHGAFVNFPMATREWIDVLGWFAYPKAFHFIWDTVIEMIGDATHIVYAPKDRFYMENDAVQTIDPDKLTKDAEKFLWWSVNERREAVAKIRQAIERSAVTA